MTKFNDDILNRYLDGELSDAEVGELKNELAVNDSLSKRFDALKRVHTGLYNLQSFEPSANFTAALMKKIGKKYRVNKEQHIFIFSVSSFFVLISIGIITYLAVNLLGSGEAGSSENIMRNIGAIRNGVIDGVKFIFSEKSSSIVGSLLAFVVLVTGYFFFENIRHIKGKVR